MPSLSVIIPTLQAESQLPDLLAALGRQTQSPDEILVIDSSSSDHTLALAQAAGCRTEKIARAEFNHGHTRNLAALAARGDILIFMTQDALPADGLFLSELVAPIATGRAAASFARQLPYPDATPLARFQRLFQYPPHSPDPTSGVQLKSFCSNSASAVSREAFAQVEGFPAYVLCCEDQILSLKLQQQGWRVDYVPEAKVFHSHNLSWQATFRRYFDNGAAFASSQAAFGRAHVGGDGLRYARGLLRFLARRREWSWFLPAGAELAGKALGYFAGQHASQLPLWLTRRFTTLPGYWTSRRPAWQAGDPVVAAAAREQVRAARAGLGS